MGSRNEADPAPAAHGNSSSATSTDRVKLEIKGAKLNVAIQSALRRKRGHQDKVTPPGDALERAAGEGPSHDATVTASGRDLISSSSTASAVGREAALLKESSGLKFTIETLRAGVREKEDHVTELEREKEMFAEQASRFDSINEENAHLRKQVAELEGRLGHLQSKLVQAEAGRALTTTLMETLKSAQNDLRRAHGQVSQRCAELENVSEDTCEAIRRGDILLHNQQLKVDAQSRQLKRQESDLAALREEREVQLTKADRAGAELAQVLRREKASRSHLTDIQREVEELKAELDSMKEAFVRHRSVVRKNQDVIDSHEKALQGARSELLSLTLEAEKQSARHGQAAADAAAELARVTAEKDIALGDNRGLRVENEGLKDRLEESGRKLEEEAAATAAAAKLNSGTPFKSFDSQRCSASTTPRLGASATSSASCESFAQQGDSLSGQKEYFRHDTHRYSSITNNSTDYDHSLPQHQQDVSLGTTQSSTATPLYTHATANNSQQQHQQVQQSDVPASPVHTSQPWFSDLRPCNGGATITPTASNTQNSQRGKKGASATNGGVESGGGDAGAGDAGGGSGVANAGERSASLVDAITSDATSNRKKEAGKGRKGGKSVERRSRPCGESNPAIDGSASGMPGRKSRKLSEDANYTPRSRSSRSASQDLLGWS